MGTTVACFLGNDCSMRARSLDAESDPSAVIASKGLLGAAALDGVALGAPAQHAAGEVGDLGEARPAAGSRSPAPSGCRRGTPRRSAGRARNSPARSASSPSGISTAPADMAERPGEFVRLRARRGSAPRRQFLEPVRLDLPDAGKAVAQRRPARIGARSTLGFASRAGRSAGWPAPRRRSSWGARGADFSCSRRNRPSPISPPSRGLKRRSSATLVTVRPR